MFHRILTVVVLGCGSPAGAQTWTETGDAPALPPGQATSGAGTLWQIDGALGVSGDVDLFAINIENPGAFEANTIGGATFDTQLFLFDVNGLGITHNDDVSGSTASRISGQFVPGPGTYLLAISRWDRDPVSAGNLQIWNDTPYELERAPDGPGRFNPIVGWIGASSTGPYSIYLSGVSYSDQPAYGACCFGTYCQMMYEQDCGTNGGEFQGDGTYCEWYTCQSQPPPNDTCANAEPIGDGAVSFSNIGANTDGPSACGALGSDIWYRYQPACGGMVTVSTCGGSAFDTVIAAYEDDGCQLATLLACNDDWCGLQTEMQFLSLTGGSYLIRVGGFAGQQGEGTMTVTGPTVGPAPQILQHPQWQPVQAGGTATFQVVATGVEPLRYEWRHAGVIVPDGTGPILIIPEVQEPDHGPYNAYVYDACDRLVRSHSADLTVYPDCQPPIADPGGCYVPDVWKIDPVPWNRDVAPPNKIDDLIDTNPGIRYDIIVDFRECVTPGHIQFLENISPQSSVGEVFKVISSVEMLNVSRPEMLTIAGHIGVALIEKNVTVTAHLDVSLENIKVIGPAYSPDTVDDAYGYSGDGYNIAIVDTGVDDIVHDTFTSDPGMFVGGYNTFTNLEGNPDDDHLHGTHVASIALGRGGVFVQRGVAPKAGLIDVKVLNAAGSGTIVGVMRGLQKLLDKQHDWNVHIVNMSLGGPDATNGVESFSQLTDRLVAHGMIVVVSAGNSFPGQVSNAPARAARAITVAASDDLNTATRTDDVIAPFSQTGPALDNSNSDAYDELKPEITAPGRNIVAAAFNSPDGTSSLSGTSMAAPHVAGVAALCLQAKPSLNPESLRALLINTAERRGGASAAGVGLLPAGWNARWGWGLIDAYAAIDKVLTGPTDMRFGDNPAPESWDNQNIGPVNFPPQCGVANQLFAVVKNAGPNRADNVRVSFGVYNFNGASPPFIHIGTAVIDSLLPGVTRTVTIDWIPNCTGVSAHQCLKVEIGCDNEANGLNNTAQRNLDITNSPLYFTVANYVSATPITITFEPRWENPGNGWDVQITPPSVTIGPDDLPPTIEVLPLPPPGAPDGAQQVLYVESQATGNFCLGGVTIICRMRDCNTNGSDDWFDIRDGVSEDSNENAVPDECDRQHCPGDLNGDGLVDLGDLTVLLANFGVASGSQDLVDGDVSGDRDIDLEDLAILLGAFGSNC